jgi:hypothetical protein
VFVRFQQQGLRCRAVLVAVNDEVRAELRGMRGELARLQTLVVLSTPNAMRGGC